MNTHYFDNQRWRFLGITVVGFFFICLLLAMPAEALRLKTTWAERVDLSEKIVRGEVVEVKSYWNPEKTLIYTDVTVLVDEHIKGNGLREITITILGGTVGDDTLWVSDTPRFSVGDYGVILLESSGQVTGGPDGVYSLQKPMVGTSQPQSMIEDRFLSWIKAYVNGQTQISFQEVSEETLGIPLRGSTSYTTISGVSPSTVSTGTGSVLTVSGSAFGASRGTGNFPTIAFRYKDSNYMYSNSVIVSWSDKQISVNVFTAIISNYPYSPGSWSDTVAFVNSSGNFESFYPLTITFGYGQAKWATSPVSYYVNATGGPSGSESAIQAAANTWSGAGANFSFSYAGTTSIGVGKDNANVISFADLGSSSIIAQATSWISGEVVTESDIQFNTGFAFSTDTPTPVDKMDLQSIVLHELGHWLRLLDLYGAYDTAKVMYGYKSDGQMERTLTSSDQQGIQWIYPDNTPPDTTITGGPSGNIYSNSATFTYTGTDNVTSTGNLVYATYLQGYDSGWSSFSSSTTKSYSSLPYGSYTFQVKAMDQAGNEDSTPATRSFTVLKPLILQSPDNGAVFDSCNFINGHQPSFEWTANETFSKFTILFSTSSIDFSNPIVKATLQATKLIWTPSIGSWKTIMTASYNNGNIKNIYWKVVGAKPDKTTIESEVRSFLIGDPQAASINAPVDGSILPSGTPPTFVFDTNCNTKFKLEFSSLDDFSDLKKVKGFDYSTRDPNVETALHKTLSSSQWSTVKKLVGTGTGHFRIKAWDVINRETVSEVKTFTVQ